MQIITTEEIRNKQSITIAQAPAAIDADLAALAAEPGYQLAWTSDVSQFVPFKATGTHILQAGDTVHTTAWPAPSGPWGLIHDLEKSKVKLGDWQVIVTSASLYEKLFGEKHVSKREIAEDAEDIASQLLKLVESYFSPAALPYLKFICAVGDTGRKISAELRKADTTTNVINARPDHGEIS